MSLLALGATETTITVTSAAGFPATPFIIEVDTGGNAETMQVTNKNGGTTWTVQRGYGTTAQSHAGGAPVSWGGGIGTADNPITVTSAAGFPPVPFTIQVDTGANAETMQVTNKNGGTTWAVTRGFDGTTARSHSGGAAISWGGTVGTSDTTINVTSASGFPSVPFTIKVDNEEMQVTAMSGTTWTVERHYDSTSAAKHSGGATVTTIVGKTDTTIRVDQPPQGWFPSSGTFNIAVDSEKMTVIGGMGTTTWTVTRHVLSTTAATHTGGKTVQNLNGWAPSATTAGVWVPVGLSGTDLDLPAAYNPSGRGDYTNASADIVTSIACISAVTRGTNLATPIRMAQWYLDTYGRPGVTKGILLETDGFPQDSGLTGQDDNAAFTCRDADAAARAAKLDGIKIYAVGYGVDSSCQSTYTNSYETGQTPAGSNLPGLAYSGMSASNLLKSMASGTKAPFFFMSPSGADIADAFQQVAIDLLKGGSHLISLYPPPVVTKAEGAYSSVTISGKNFTGVTEVKFGGASVLSIPSKSDTSLTVQAPSRSPGTTVNVVVTTPGGTSAITSVSTYTYP